MKVLIYGLNYSPELTGIGKYTGDMGDWLAAKGYNVRVVTAPPYYPEWAVRKGFSAWRYRRETVAGSVVYRCPLFVPRKPGRLSRLLHLMSFALSSLPVLLLQTSWRPDIVITVIPTLFCVPGALIVAKISGSRSVVHIQDFELDAMVGLGMQSDGWVVKFARVIERWLIRRFDVVTSISASMVAHVSRKIGRQSNVFLFPNWVDTRFITLRSRPSTYRAEWGIPDSTRVVLYSGNIGEKQGLDLLLEAAKAFEPDDGILFAIVGAGATYASLGARAHAMKLRNVRFFAVQPYDRLPELLALADVHLVLQRRGAADLVMPSKLATILAAGGHSVITAEEGTELGRLCERYPGIAHRVEPESVQCLVDGLRAVLAASDPNERNHVARCFAEERLDRERVLMAFREGVLEQCNPLILPDRPEVEG